MRFAFLIIIPGNAAAFACHSEKIFRRCSGRMNFLRITGGIDDAANAGERSKAIKTVALIGHRQGENAVFLQERITIVEKPYQVGGVFEDVRPDDPVVNVAPADELYVRPAIPNEIDLLDVVEVDPVRPDIFRSAPACHNGRGREHESPVFLAQPEHSPGQFRGPVHCV